MNRFWDFKIKNEKQAELYLYGNISETSWWGDEVTPKQFLNDLNALGKKDEIIVRINSSGGDVFAAYAIATNLKDNPAKIIAKIDGIAASAATVITSLCDEVWAPPYAEYMVHNPKSSVWLGEAKDFKKMAEVLENIKDGIINSYIMKTGLTRDELTKMMDEETWLTGAEAAKFGFVNKLMFVDDEPERYLNQDKILVFNSVQHDLSKFKQIPSHLLNKVNITTNLSVSNQVKSEITNKNEGGNDMEINTIEDLKKHYPELVNKIINEAKEEATMEERNRLKSIDEIADSLDRKLVNQAKYGENVMNAEELAFMAVKNDQALGNKFLGSLQDDISQSGVDGVVPDGTGMSNSDEESKKTISAMVAGANERRR